MNNVRLYVGFGGSGAKSILSFVELLAAHSEWGSDSDTHFAFVLVDTDKRDLYKYADAIKAVCQRIGKDPIIHTLQTSEGVPIFQHYAANRLQNAGHHEKLQDHWWYKGDAPFTAEALNASPEEGAGQCPMVSTFLAWNTLERMGTEIKSVVEQLQRRMVLATGNQNFPISCSFIAGLAGGTGRGCWHLLAFKVRQVLAKLGINTLPVGYFFDSSVFNEIMVTNPGQANKMRINSLTGFSELHCWMTNEQSAMPYNYSLPNIDSPADESSNLINVKEFVSDKDGKILQGIPGQSPVSQAFVLFGGGKAGDPGTPSRYYKILANTMYARMVQEIVSEGINTGLAFGGVGSASIEVPINDIKEYVKQYVSKFLPSFYSKEADKPEIIQSWSERLTKEFVAPSPFGFAGNSEGNIYERLIHGALVNQTQRLKRLEESMEKQDHKTAEDECKRIDGWVNSKDGKSAIEGIAKKLLVEILFGSQSSKDAIGTGGLLRQFGVLDQLSPVEFSQIYGGDLDVPTLNCTTVAFKRIIMANELTNTNKDGTIDRIRIAPYGVKAQLAVMVSKEMTKLAKRVPGAPPEVGAAFKTSSDEFLKARKGFLQGRIDQNEAGIIKTAAQNGIRMKCMGCAQPVFQKVLNEAADKLERLAKDLTSIVKLLNEKSKTSEQACAVSRDKLFWNEFDYRKICSQSGDQLYNAEMLSEQRLQPVVDDQVLETKLEKEIDSGANERFHTEQSNFNSRILNWLQGDVAGADQNERNRDLKRLIEKGIGVLSGELVLKQDFYVSQFGFYGVIKNLIVDWGKNFRKRAGSEQDTVIMNRAFRVLFGTDYKRDGDGVLGFMGDELDAETRRVCQCIAVELANRCDVLFHQKLSAGQVDTPDQASVILPGQENFNEAFISETATYATDAKRFPRAGFFKPIRTFDKGRIGNPFGMVAYAQLSFNWRGEKGKGLDTVASLGYYKDPNVSKWLNACEDKNGLSVFCHDPEELPQADSSYGLGYTSPIFVKNDHLRELRWRPWASHGVAVTNDRAAFAWDVIIFALLDEPASGEIGKNMNRVTAEEGWQMPLIALQSSQTVADDQARKWQFTRPAFRMLAGERSATHPAMKSGLGYNSIKKLKNAFEGALNPLSEAIADEAVIFIRDVLLKHEDEVSPQGALKAMFAALQIELESSKADQTGHTQDEYQALYDELILRVTALTRKTPKELFSHFERRGRA